MKLTATERHELAAKRLTRLLQTHTIANARTIEQKISDAGPYGQRIDPHVLTTVRNQLIKDDQIIRRQESNTPWFHLADTPQETPGSSRS